MSASHPERCCALQALFQFDLGGGPADCDLLARSFRARASESRPTDPIQWECDFPPEAVEGGLTLARAAWDSRDDADRDVTALAPEWPTNRQANVDRNILRIGYWELVRGGVPAPLAINGAVELAKVYSTERSYAFINAILDRIAISRAEQPLPGDRVV